jgi:hypothetical protein
MASKSKWHAALVCALMAGTRGHRPDPLAAHFFMPSPHQRLELGPHDGRVLAPSKGAAVVARCD